MLQLDEQAAARAIESLGFCEANRSLARYWLSLFNDGLPPPRAAIRPSQVKDLLPGIAILDVHTDGSVVCRLAGSAIAMGLGVDPTGQDVIALTPPEHRAARLVRYQRVTGGAISRGSTIHHSRLGTPVPVEDIQLPLGGFGEDGTRQIILHANWRPKTLDRTSAELVDGWAIGVDEMIQITRSAA